MNGMPVILYIESRYGESHGENSDREALSFFLKNDCGCDVHLYDYLQDFQQDKNNVSKLLTGGWVILVILKQHSYMEKEHLEGIEFIRTSLSRELPIVILPDWHEGRFEPSAETPNVFAYSHESPELSKLVSDMKLVWRKPDDAFGVESDKERDLLCRHLENAYKVNYLDGDNEMMLGTPDPNTQVVLEALRLRLLPVSFVKEEFDDTLPRRKQKFDAIDVNAYEQEISRIRSLSEADRKELSDDMLRARGMTPCETGGVFCNGVGQGDNAWGYAIDWQTLQNVITDRFGEHQLAKHYLLEKLVRLEMMRSRGSRHDDAEYACARRMLFGLILQKVNGYSLPIACMWSEGADEDRCRRVAEHILKERRFIPVTPDGYIFGTG